MDNIYIAMSTTSDEHRSESAVKDISSLKTSNTGHRKKDSPILSRSFVYSIEQGCTHSMKMEKSNLITNTFTLVTYNILADCHAQRDYNKSGNWITEEELSIEYRHKLMMEELKWLDADIICLQEVGSEYFGSTLKPYLQSFGYDGIYIGRCSEYEEGEATFYKSSRFNLKESEGIILKDVLGMEISNSINDEVLKKSLLESVDSYAVSLLTRLENKKDGSIVFVANVHIAYDKFERQDKQCLQIAATIRKMQKLSEPSDGQIICGDFNSWPSSPPQELINEGRLSEENANILRNILIVNCEDASQPTSMFDHIPELFCLNASSNYKSAYKTVMGSEPYTSRFNSDSKVRRVDFIYFSDRLKVCKVLEVPDKTLIMDGVPNSQFPSDHLSLMAEFNFV